MTNASQSGRLRIGGAFEVNRLGFGAMRIVGQGRLGAARGPGRSDPDAQAPARTRRRFHRHRRFLRARFLGEPDPRGAAPLRVDQDRDQGRSRPHRPECLDPARPARISDPAGLEEPLAARRRDSIDLWQLHRIDSEGARGRAVRRDQDADQGQASSARAGLSEVSVAEIEAASKILPGRDGAEPLQSRRPSERSGARLLRRVAASASFRGSRSTPANSPARARRSTPIARAHKASAGPDRARVAAEAQPVSCCRSPAPARSPISRRTSARRRSS